MLRFRRSQKAGSNQCRNLALLLQSHLHPYSYLRSLLHKESSRLKTCSAEPVCSQLWQHESSKSNIRWLCLVRTFVHVFCHLQRKPANLSSIPLASSVVCCLPSAGPYLAACQYHQGRFLQHFLRKTFTRRRDSRTKLCISVPQPLAGALQACFCEVQLSR